MLSETLSLHKEDSTSLLPDRLLSEGISGFSIDSLCIRIPLSEAQVLNPSLTASIEVLEIDKETGEVYVSRDKDTSTKVRSGDSTSGNHREYRVHSSKSGDQREVVIWLSSKTLGSLYFKGITSETLPLIYQRIQEDAQVSFSFDSLLRAKISDIDVKRDFIFTEPPEILFSFYKHLQSVYNSTPHKRRGVTVFGDFATLNYGLDLNERRYVKTVSSTFFKSYYKGGLLLKADSEFLEDYLSEIEEKVLRTIHRQEITISGVPQAKALRLPSYSCLQEFLEIPDSAFEEAISLVMQANFTKTPFRMKSTESDSKYSLRQQIVLACLQHLLSTGLTVPQARDIIVSRTPDRKQRHRANKEITEALRILSGEGFSTGDKSITPERLTEQAEAFDKLYRLFNY